MTQRLAGRAALDHQTVLLGCLEPESVVRVESRTRTQCTRSFGRSRFLRFEPQRPPPLGADNLIVTVAVGLERRDEVSDTEAGLLLRRNRLDDLGVVHAIAWAQFGEELLIGIGGHDRAVAGCVEGGDQIGPHLRRVVARHLVGKGPHDPDLKHLSGSDDAVTAGGAGSVVVEVDGVGIAHGLGPMPDHGDVDLVWPPGSGNQSLADKSVELRRNVAHLTLFSRTSPKPMVPTMSRRTSLTPPPKVFTTP